jgi:Zn-dependent protease with chaperone function
LECDINKLNSNTKRNQSISYLLQASFLRNNTHTSIIKLEKCFLWIFAFTKPDSLGEMMIGALNSVLFYLISSFSFFLSVLFLFFLFFFFNLVFLLLFFLSPFSQMAYLIIYDLDFGVRGICFTISRQ